MNSIDMFRMVLTGIVDERLNKLRLKMAKGITPETEYWHNVGQHAAMEEMRKVLDDAYKSSLRGPLED